MADDKEVPSAISKELGNSDTEKKNDEDPRKGLPSNVEVENADSPMELKQYARDDEGPWIQYNGVATVRVMGPEEWSAAGVKSDDYFEWNYLNQKRIPRKFFSDEQLQYMLRVDGRFSLEDK